MYDLSLDTIQVLHSTSSCRFSRLSQYPFGFRCLYARERFISEAILLNPPMRVIAFSMSTLPCKRSCFLMGINPSCPCSEINFWSSALRTSISLCRPGTLGLCLNEPSPFKSETCSVVILLQSPTISMLDEALRSSEYLFWSHNSSEWTTSLLST